jgi:hypothetical protein
MRLPVLLKTLRDHGVLRYKSGDVEIELGDAPERPQRASTAPARADMHTPVREKAPDALATVLADKFPELPGADGDEEAN